MVKSCLKKSTGNEKLSFTELLTVLFEVENVLSNRPLCVVYDDDVSDVLTPNCLLYGRNLNRENKIVEEIDFGVMEECDLWEKKFALENVVKHFWSVWYREYLNGLPEQNCTSLGRGAAVIKIGDVLMIGEDVVPRYKWRLGLVVELIKSNNGLVRGAKVKVGKTRNVIRRPVNCLYPTEVRAVEQLHCNIRNVRKTKKKDVGNNNLTEVTLSKRDVAVAGELRRRLNDTDVDP